MSALTKSEMADKLFEELGLNKREAKELVEQFFEEIRICLENNEQVKLSGFGNFDLRDSRALETLTLEISVSDREETRKLAKQYRFRPGE